MFVCLEFFVPFENFSLIWRRHHCRRRAANFDLCSALLVRLGIEQWEFFSVPHLLRHGASVCYGHLRGPVTLTPNAERLAVELSLPVLKTWSVANSVRTSNYIIKVSKGCTSKCYWSALTTWDLIRGMLICPIIYL